VDNSEATQRKSSAQIRCFLRARELSRVIHQLYSVSQIPSCQPSAQSPPGLQLALVQLTDALFPKKEWEKPVCLVRPQWKYNLTYVPLTHYLREIVSPSVLDPSGTLGAQTPDEFLERVWQKWADAKNKGPFPKQLAVLSVCWSRYLGLFAICAPSARTGTLHRLQLRRTSAFEGKRTKSFQDR